MSLSTAVREWADAAGVERPKRGPVPRSLVVAYFTAQPRAAREAARAAGVPVTARGPLSAASVEKIAASV